MKTTDLLQMLLILTKEGKEIFGAQYEYVIEPARVAIFQTVVNRLEALAQDPRETKYQ